MLSHRFHIKSSRFFCAGGAQDLDHPVYRYSINKCQRTDTNNNRNNDKQTVITELNKTQREWGGERRGGEGKGREGKFAMKIN